jgi:hypothetical protein
MSNNKHDPQTTNQIDSGSNLNKMLELFLSKLEEKFVTIKDSYRFLDKNLNNRLSFDEFVGALDELRVKFSLETL